jgi:DASS family divalent anion:Na+ symporter
VLYKLSPPEIKSIPHAHDFAQEKLNHMGGMSRDEWIMIAVFVGMLILWIFGSSFGVHACTTSLVGLSALIMTGVLNWKDILNEHEGWHTLVWLAVLVTMSTHLDHYGVMRWFGNHMGSLFIGFHPMVTLCGLGLIYFYSHYLFAGNTTHVSSMYGPFLLVAVTAGAPPLLSALLLGFFSSLFSSMTHYGTSPASILFSSGYVPIGDWWKNGLIISVVNLIIWLGLGGMWWKVLGLW